MTNETNSKVAARRTLLTSDIIGSQNQESHWQIPPHLPEGTPLPGSASRMEFTQIEEPEVDFGLEELRVLPRSIPLYRVNTDSLVSGLELKPLLQGLYKFGHNARLWEQRDTVLRLVASHLQRPFLRHLTPAKRFISRDIFPEITRQLNNLMTKVSRANIPASDARIQGDNQFVPVYSLDRLSLATHSYHFDRMAKVASQSFEYAGQQLPGIPTWPKEGGSTGVDYLLENDFEILAITYRASVEDFLTRLVDIHDFRTGQMQLLPLIEEDYRPNLYQAQKTDKRTGEEPRRSFGAGDSISTAGQASYSQRTPSSHSARLPRQSRRVREMWEGSDEERDDSASGDEAPQLGGPPKDPGGDPSDDESDDGRDDWRRGGRRSNRQNDQRDNQRDVVVNVQSDDYDDLFEDLLTEEEDFDSALQTAEELSEIAENLALEGDDDSFVSQVQREATDEVCTNVF
ncbi:hypothetical protein PQX77_015526, partial [Marasmius sp. AFHP31]